MDGEDKKLRIGFVLDRFTPSRGGESYFSRLAQELVHRGHEVHIFAMEVQDCRVAEVHCHRIPVVKYPPSLRLLSFLLNSARVLKGVDLDIIHGVGQTLSMNVLNPHGGVEKAYLKQEFLSISNRFYYLYKFLRQYVFLQHYLKIWIQKKQYLNAKVRKIIAISQMIKGDIIRHYGVPREKIVVVLNCVDLDRFHPRNRELYRNAKRMALGINENTLLLLFAGNNYRLKGLQPLLRALAILRQRVKDQPFRLLIAGRGQTGRYLRIARKLGVSDLTLFLGPVGEMEQLYGASDIYVHPTFYDSCSLTVLEALASGLPVITSRFNGAADAVISDKGGRIIRDPADVNELAESIACYFDPDRRDEARIASRQFVERYSPAQNVEDTLRVYYEVVGW
jgi:UDP-glucose:(heptosyl)LPS alpha-1,3-glucosyltransferase